MARRKAKDVTATAVYNAIDDPVPDKTIPRVSPCEDYIFKILRSRYWKANAPKRFHSLTIVNRSRAKTSFADTAKGRIFIRACYRLIVCHELAHFLTPEHCANHGPEFLHYYQALGDRFLPKKTAASLRRRIAMSGLPVAKRPVRRAACVKQSRAKRR